MNLIEQRHVPEIRRALANFKYEATPGGILVGAGINRLLNGAFKHTLIHADGSRDVALDPNLVVDEGLIYLLNTGFAGGTAKTAWYVALFEGNYTPAAGLQAAGFDTAANELTGYASGTRPAWTVSATSTPSLGNTGSEALFVFDSSGPYTAYGAALLSSAVKGNNAGDKCASATRFAAPRTGLNSPDKLAVEYIVTAQDAG